MGPAAQNDTQIFAPEKAIVNLRSLQILIDSKTSLPPNLTERAFCKIYRCSKLPQRARSFLIQKA
jgi:hypothetical protein